MNKKCKEIIGDKYLQEKFLTKIENIKKVKQDKVTEKRHNQVQKFENLQHIHEKIVENKPSFMTEYEYRQALVHERKSQEQLNHLKKCTFLLQKHEIIRKIEDKNQAKIRRFLRKSRLAQQWTIKLVLGLWFITVSKK